MHTLISIFSLIAQVLLVIVLCGNPKALGIFFLIAAALVALRKSIPAALHNAYIVFAVAVMALVTLQFRHLPMVEHPGANPTPAVETGFIGISYAFLRFVSALVESQQWSLQSLVRYFFFLPTFFSGPVIEPRHLQNDKSGFSRVAFSEGLLRIFEGAVRICLSYFLMLVIPLGSKLQLSWCLERWSVISLWAGTFLSGVWLYLNFSGYSEIFIGIARMSGVFPPENFENPYSAVDLTAFWQRWHISLGNWLRTMVYNPLSRAIMGKTLQGSLVPSLVAPIVTMVVCGFWHSASTAFIIWGLAHGLWLSGCALWEIIRKALIPDSWTLHPAYRTAGWLITHAFIVSTWVFFLPVDGAVSLDMRLNYLHALFGGKS
ncbi:MAG: hypothetical protein HQM09_20595 [Candidatus Riflebacteria bacterium]|nr:hypothetical protein [Candidatus Riflebacteria bacterium]